MAKPSGSPKTQPAKPLSEDDMIALWLAPLAGPAGLGLRDDAALITVPAGFQLVTTVDALVAGVHFFADDPPASIARKVLGVNLSDLAAKGSTPFGFLLSMTLPKQWPQQDLRALHARSSPHHPTSLGIATFRHSRAVSASWLVATTKR